MTPRVMPPTPVTDRSPPSTAVKTNCRLPMLPITGPIMLPYLLAFAELSKSASLSLSNSSLDCSSWLKTFTTLCPFILSSTKPVTSARDTCWRMKYLPLLEPILFVTFNMTKMITTARIVSSGLNTSMEINVTMIVNNAINACGIAWLIICLNVSVSLV